MRLADAPVPSLGAKFLARQTTASCPVGVDFDRKAEACMTRLETKYLNQ
jgi:hypothetical protein